jgi:hypothetical protein
MKTVNIDGDIIKYLAGFAVEKQIWTYKPTGDWFEGKTAANDWFIDFLCGPQKNDKGQRVGLRKWMAENWREEDWESELELEEWKNCKFIIDNKIDECRDACKADDVKVFLSPSTCFRNEVAVTLPYKGNRRDLPKPQYAEKIIEYFMDFYDTVINDNLEADDLIGMQSENNCTASTDKDLDMIAGEHYNFSTGELYYVDPFSANRWFFVQLLAGDATDNIQGVPKIGMKTAERIVDDILEYGADDEWDELREEVRNQYEDNYEDGDAALKEHAELVYILRPGDTPETKGWEKLLYGIPKAKT